jgi:hypothetical protein
MGPGLAFLAIMKCDGENANSVPGTTGFRLILSPRTPILTLQVGVGGHVILSSLFYLFNIFSEKDDEE